MSHPPQSSIPVPANLRARLLRWYKHERRDLPWRRERDPYAIWISEVMLQQTQVSTVIPYFQRFLARFPGAAVLARAGQAEVLSLWSGLGYYRRARSLHAAARIVVGQHGGRLPRDVQTLMQLPGIGRSTAGAIASIAFGQPEPILDGNVRRVLSRLFAINGRAGSSVKLWKIACSLVQGPQPGELNQALMELGATLCTSASPRCAECPLHAHCRARAAGRVELYPAKRARAPAAKVPVAVAWLVRRGRILLERPAATNPLRGTWDLPAVELKGASDAAAAIRDALAKRHGLTVRVGEPLGQIWHSIMHRRLKLELFDCRLDRGLVAGRSELSWLCPTKLEETPLSGATRKLVRGQLSVLP